VLYLYGWTVALAALALALRFVPYSDDHGHFNLGWSLVMVGFAVPALVASIYLVLVLEILKLKRFRQFQLRRARMLEGEPPPAEAEVDAGVAHELETGEFEVVDHNL
jgi:UDP-GlcNAc:undecaprenyl-phosphate GlcNAc-1-phosphate transferase